ncbi:NAD-dependent succinate-semialdehyde dehydrogenase [Oceanobacillus alkalisoli]|uniref:NAD-dependent succinate-semialdehyde dehydrogenase n=1 Tax=Oceanobacillus alkalisoli TaxID=2925113 RepID=UPI001F121241|nr:NAD-dependent succinate-semialdehyde dehydrogenase [Oceanobacillus alkalisoli]MCF3944104.1 NAD-dependent succinate-semialdehyde dehydrogenase [Oceanobacillus alkalisoli]
MAYINGRWIETASQLEVINPATNEIIGKVPVVGKTETIEAIESAKEAFKSWKKTTFPERVYYLEKVVTLLREQHEEIAQLITKENGKPIGDSRDEVESGIAYIEWYAEEAKRIYGDVLPASSQNKHLIVKRQPIGVCAAITPWNFPFSMITRKIAPALATGCTVVLKPASATPLSAVKVFECFDKAGLPEGVINLVIGSAQEIGNEMTKSEDVRKISFTGSTAVGKLLFRDSADTVKAISMELGGHAPFIVFDDSDVNIAVEGILNTKFGNSGQTCVSTNRIYVQSGIAEKFTKALTKKVSKLKVGNGLDEDVDVGPIIDQKSFDKIMEQIEDVRDKKGKIICGGKQYANNTGGKFIQPTIITEANEKMLIATEETFGPVVPIFTFETEEEIIEKANHKHYGLAGYCYTSDLGRAFRVSEELEYGMIGVNDSSPFVIQAPFGGIKESGLGQEGGKYGLEGYLITKYISFNANY